MVGKNYQFPKITKSQHDDMAKWYKSHNDGICANSYHGAIGGNVEFIIVPTSIGDVVTACCSCGEKFDLSNI